ncbi:MAG: DUF2993 domain-containing protein [Leptolyngbyaceae cyanobacterium RM2_2_4]|nr:DUF2993 domain-containing protein [Leptolyngbyaceae cyanobacterium SM1_4_3]NJN89987.1 DUF2993 domain-containing protein [Leptolyngbyaceae cyanobacterium SL_5_14]NJO51777.1 DUF2993 domain-containing protein [Leptolyngbyaceae cyanobacterium RM2_2_4]
MTKDNRSLEGQALSKVAEIGIKSQLDEVQEVEVDVDAQALELAQGKVDSVSIQSKGMVMEKDLRVEDMSLQTGNVSINPLGIAFGKVELTRPADASAQVVLLEQDINRAFNSEYIRSKMQELDVHLEGKPVKVDIPQVDFRLLDSEKVALSATMVIRETGGNEPVAFTAKPEIDEGGQRVVLTQVEYQDGKNPSPELTEALLERSAELLDLRNFELEGMTLKIQKLDISEGKLLLQTAAHIEQFSS